MSDQAGGFDIGGLLEQAQQMQQQIAEAQQAAASETYEGSSGGGAVRISANGLMEFQAVDIDAAVVDPDDPEMLGDLVLAALRDLTAKITDAVSAVSAPDLGSMDLGGLGDMMGDLLGGGGPDDEA